MNAFRTARLNAAIAVALAAMMGCATPGTRTSAPASPRIEPVQSVRHGMSTEQTYRLARTLQDRGETEAALAALRQVILADPLHADAHNATAVILTLNGEAARAEAEFRLAIALAPQAAYLKQNLALHLQRMAAAPAAPAPASAAAVPASAASAPVAAPIEPPKPLQALAPMPAPTVRLDRVAESVWQLRNGAFLQEVPAEPVRLASNAAVAVVPDAPRAAAPALRYRVEVANGNGTTGLARRTSLLLPRESLEGVRLTNQKPYGVAGSVIQHVQGAEAAAREVHGALPVDVPLVRVERIERDAAVRLVLGRDFPAAAADGVKVAAR